MSEKLDKEQPDANMLAAFASTIVGAFALGLPMAVAIIWFCSDFLACRDGKSSSLTAPAANLGRDP